jgi:hypothetical protein
MKKVLFVSALCAAMLGGCESPKPPPSVFSPAKLDPTKPQVDVRDGYVVVAPEPLVFKRTDTPVDVVWELPAGSKFRFALARGIQPEGKILTTAQTTAGTLPLKTITIDPNETADVVCKVLKDGLAYTCKIDRAKQGQFKYTIRLLEGDKPIDPLDPSWIVH